MQYNGRLNLPSRDRSEALNWITLGGVDKELTWLPHYIQVYHKTS